MHERGEGRSRGELTTEDHGAQQEQGWYDRPHEELVGAFRDYIAERHRKAGRHAHLYQPENIIHDKLWAAQAGGKQRSDFFEPIARAWDAVAFDRYEPGSSPHWRAADTLHFSGEPTVRLTDPLQVRILDALAEAVGLPYERGQVSIPIPEKLVGTNYIKWELSPERARELAEARARREREDR